MKTLFLYVFYAYLIYLIKPKRFAESMEYILKFSIIDFSALHETDIYMPTLYIYW